MKIERMFREDINRKINGVVKVDQDADDVLVQELDEYVITRELKRHFITFFNNYGDAFRERTDSTGVWISGFFGSGKSHFLKMLSYLLENKEVRGKKTVERFRGKFEDDPGTFMQIDRATRGETDTILFNIDIEGPINKDRTAVLRVFAKMFYKFLGFYGEDLKVAKLEQFIAGQGKTGEFHRIFEEKNGKPWLESRAAFAFLEDEVVETLRQALGMSETSARNWFNGTETVEISIAQLVSEIKAYADSRPKDYRLLFMADEVGQYVGGDTDLLLNLQSLVEKIGSECGGRVWVVCTGQEAIDEIIKARENEFSRIQARFRTRLSLSSASADEVIRKRILLKTPEANAALEQVYAQNDAVLRNLFSFQNAVRDIKGYGGPEDFASNFPFVPYQFILMQKVFTEIRKHGHSGTHLSGGERSMLSGFQEAAQKIRDRDETALAPFHLFYDTVHSFLDSAVRRVIERCERAAESGDGIEARDVDALKLLYLVRYVDDLKATLDNIVILMADAIHLDKIAMREQVRASLERLLGQNYIGRSGDAYNFLTDEEPDIQREIAKTPVDTSSIVERIGRIVFEDIYPANKHRSGRYDFAFGKMVDSTTIGGATGGMRLRILTVAADAFDKTEMRLLVDSKGQAVVALADRPYYESLEQAMKVRKYVKQRDVAQLPKSKREIIRRHQEEANRLEAAATEALTKAIEAADFYVDGGRVDLQNGDAKSKLDQALERLVARVYSELPLITKHAESDADIAAALRGSEVMIVGTEPNLGAAAKVEEYLEMQRMNKLQTSMADVQGRFQAIPYGWREIDIAAVVARLVHGQKVTIKYGGATVQPSDPKLPDMLRKKSETGKTIISGRQAVALQTLRAAREFLRDYFDEMDVPQDEDGLVAYIGRQFTEELRRCEELLGRYAGRQYPDEGVARQSADAVREVLAQQKDNTALIDHLVQREDELCDLKERLRRVEDFFRNQAGLFDAAARCEAALRVDAEYIAADGEASAALAAIREIITIPESGRFDYSRIPGLNALVAAVKERHGAMLDGKRQELFEVARQCADDIHAAGKGHAAATALLDEADAHYARQRTKIAEAESLALMEGFPTPMWQYREEALANIERALRPPEPVAPTPKTREPAKPAPEKRYKPVFRQSLLAAAKLETEADVDAYVGRLRDRLKALLHGSDGIELK